MALLGTRLSTCGMRRGIQAFVAGVFGASLFLYATSFTHADSAMPVDVKVMPDSTHGGTPVAVVVNHGPAPLSAWILEFDIAPNDVSLVPLDARTANGIPIPQGAWYPENIGPFTDVRYKSVKVVAAIFSDGSTAGPRGLIDTRMAIRRRELDVFQNTATLICRLAQKGESLRQMQLVMKSSWVHDAQPEFYKPDLTGFDDNQVLDFYRALDSAFSGLESTQAANKTPTADGVRFVIDYINKRSAALLADPVKTLSGAPYLTGTLVTCASV